MRKIGLCVAMTIALGLSSTLWAEAPADDVDARALAALKEQIDDFRGRADEHEFYSVTLTTIRFLMEGLSTALLAMGEDPIFNKRIPIVAMAFSRVCESWLKYRKSDEKWPNLRKKQREFEALRMLYINHATPEFQGTNRAQALISRIAAITNDAHSEWADLTKLGRQETATKNGEPSISLQGGRT